MQRLRSTEVGARLVPSDQVKWATVACRVLREARRLACTAAGSGAGNFSARVEGSILVAPSRSETRQARLCRKSDHSDCAILRLPKILNIKGKTERFDCDGAKTVAQIMR